MPIEIKELVIKAVVEPPTQTATPAALPPTPEDRDALVEACVRRVLRTLERARQR